MVNLLPIPLLILLAGPFDGVGHITALLDCSMEQSLRCCLLRLLASVLVPGAMDNAHRTITANGQAFVKAGGVQLTVGLVTGGCQVGHI